MDVIDLQRKARPREGVIEHYWFENLHIDLPRTLFHRVRVPFEPFDSGLDYVEQPEDTELVVEWVKLGLDDPSQIDGTDLATAEGVEASIYLGGAHNRVDLETFSIRRHGSRFAVNCVAYVDFEHEGVAESERFTFETSAHYRGEAQ